MLSGGREIVVGRELNDEVGVLVAVEDDKPVVVCATTDDSMDSIQSSTSVTIAEVWIKPGDLYLCRCRGFKRCGGCVPLLQPFLQSRCTVCCWPSCLM